MSQEPQKISEILDENPQILEVVLHDLHDTRDARLGAGWCCAQASFKQMHGFSYEQLAFHLLDSNSFRSFVRLPLGWIPNKSSLQRNIVRISASTWREINRILVSWAARQKLEKGHRIRVDSAAVATDVHNPTDSELLNDCIRTITRLLKNLRRRRDELAAEGEPTVEVCFGDHTRPAKKRLYQVVSRRGERRVEAYRRPAEGGTPNPGLRTGGRRGQGSASRS